MAPLSQHPSRGTHFPRENEILFKLELIFNKNTTRVKECVQQTNNKFSEQMADFSILVVRT